jgi:hypothetical protein
MPLGARYLFEKGGPLSAPMISLVPGYWTLVLCLRECQGLAPPPRFLTRPIGTDMLFRQSASRLGILTSRGQRSRSNQWLGNPGKLQHSSLSSKAKLRQRASKVTTAQRSLLTDGPKVTATRLHGLLLYISFKWTSELLRRPARLSIYLSSLLI